MLLLVAVGIGSYIYFENQKGVPTAAPEPTPPVAPVEPIVVVPKPPAPPAPVVVEAPPVEAVAPVIPVLDRYAPHILLSPDGREMQAQILDVVSGKVYIRRHDKRIFDIKFSSFHHDSQALITAWENAYAASVTPEQKAFLVKDKKVQEEVVAMRTEPDVVEASVIDDNLTGPYAKDLDSGLEWELVKDLSDEFESRRIDEDKWQIEPKGNGWVWLGRPPGLFLPENVKLEDGKMKVTVSKLDKPQTINGKEFLYQGAIVRSKEAGEMGWYYECKMKANATEMSSTFWLMTKGQTEKKLELDIQECVGSVSPDAEAWAEGWDRTFHSNLIHRVNQFNPISVQKQKAHKLKTPNHKKFYVYGAWWKSKREVQFFLDGEHVYTIVPDVDWDVPAFIQMAIETYDWNPVPERNSRVERASLVDRQTQYEWVRVWKPTSGN
ncbi:MAG: hypothetical protein ABF322_10845 [Lentimonas sp.]